MGNIQDLFKTPRNRVVLIICVTIVFIFAFPALHQQLDWYIVLLLLVPVVVVANSYGFRSGIGSAVIAIMLGLLLLYWVDDRDIEEVSNIQHIIVYAVFLFTGAAVGHSRSTHARLEKELADRKQAEQALVESERQLRLITDNLPAYVALVGIDDLRYQFVNNRFVEGYKMPRERIIGSHIRDIIGDSNYDFARRYIDIVRTGEPTSYENAFVVAEGERWVHVNYVPDISEDGEVRGIIVLSHDITGRKQAEQHRENLIREQERTRVVSDFITQSTHQFRTPLSIINTSTHLLKKLHDPSVQKQHIGRIEDQVVNITMLINGLTMMAKLDGIQHLLTRQVDLCEVINMVSTMQIPENINFDLKFDSRPLYVQADKDYIQQAIENIVENAIRAMPEGGTLTVRTVYDGDMSVVEIGDTGIGISKDDLPHIFERFYRADKMGTTRGVGLGLPVAKRIIDLHHGNIEVISTPNVGSTFKILLPYQKVP